MERSSSVLALVAALRHVIAEARHFNETSRPNYNLYLLANVREFVIGMGIVQLAVALVVVGRLNFRRLVRRPARICSQWGCSAHLWCSGCSASIAAR
jgi:hypothetical protein